MAWRLITADGVDAAEGLATDEVLARRVQAAPAPTLRLYTYRPHCALVGRFQEVEHEIDLAFCRQHDIQVNRRPTGGGAILMGPDQLGVALVVPGRGGFEERPRQLMARFSAGLVRGLRDLGIQASFRGKNDLEVNGRKIAGLGIYRDSSGGLLFHGSLLVDLDVELMSLVLKTPFEKITSKELATLADRTTTVRRRLGGAVSTEEVRQQVAAGFGSALDVELLNEELSAQERDDVAALVGGKYATDAWIFQHTSVADGTGIARIMTDEGLIDVRVSVAGRMIKAVHIRGDYVANETAMADLEGRLRWHSSDPDAVAATVRECSPIAPGPLAEAIVQAARCARDPYGCFVNPEARP